MTAEGTGMPSLAQSQAAVKVSVVVPVYNAGSLVDTCIASLLHQTLPHDELELIFVDDGSTDDSLERLRVLETEHPSLVRVISIPNSGWPGKPRNVGVEASRGEFVQFVDQDDYLGPEALERLSAMGSDADADVVIGKMVGVGRWTPSALFDRNRTDATLFNCDLVTSLTPHKMFRRSFLREHGIAFPEGKRRLEDFLYVMRCYVAASAVCVLSDYPCYFYTRRADGRNTSFTRIEPDAYFDNLAEVVEVVEKAVPAGPERDALLTRFYRSEVLRRLSEPNILRTDEEFLSHLVDRSRAAADRLFAPSTRAALAPMVRARADLLSQNRATELVEFARRCSELRAKVLVTGAQWRGGQLLLDLDATILRAERPWVLDRRGQGFALDATFVRRLGLGDRLDLADSEVELLAGVKVEVLLRNRETSIDWIVPADIAPVLRPPRSGPAVDCVGVATLDPQVAAGGLPLERGMWDLSVRIQQWGISRVSRAAVPEGMDLRDWRTKVRTDSADPLVVIPYATKHGNLTIDVGEQSQSFTGSVTRPPRRTLSQRLQSTARRHPRVRRAVQAVRRRLRSRH